MGRHDVIYTSTKSVVIRVLTDHLHWSKTIKRNYRSDNNHSANLHFVFTACCSCTRYKDTIEKRPLLWYPRYSSFTHLNRTVTLIMQSKQASKASTVHVRGRVKDAREVLTEHRHAKREGEREQDQWATLPHRGSHQHTSRIPPTQ